MGSPKERLTFIEPPPRSVKRPSSPSSFFMGSPKERLTFIEPPPRSFKRPSSPSSFMGSPKERLTFIEPPPRSVKRPSSPSKLFESPVKRQNRSIIPEDFIEPLRKPHKPLVPDFIAPNELVITTRRPPPRKHQSKTPSKARKSISFTSTWDDNIDFADGGGALDSWSPVRARDNIDWSITSVCIENLKSEVVPHYWELLLNSLHSIVRVTERLYILQDFNYKGCLKVEAHGKRLTLKGSSVQACLQNGRHQWTNGCILRLFAIIEFSLFTYPLDRAVPFAIRRTGSPGGRASCVSCESRSRLPSVFIFCCHCLWF
jgi:hypothetical protein